MFKSNITDIAGGVTQCRNYRQCSDPLIGRIHWLGYLDNKLIIPHWDRILVYYFVVGLIFI